jgi:hypothetical protein
MGLRGGGPVMGVEVTTTRPGDGKNYPSKVATLLQIRVAEVSSPSFLYAYTKKIPCSRLLAPLGVTRRLLNSCCDGTPCSSAMVKHARHLDLTLSVVHTHLHTHTIAGRCAYDALQGDTDQRVEILKIQLSSNTAITNDSRADF